MKLEKKKMIIIYVDRPKKVSCCTPIALVPREYTTHVNMERVSQCERKFPVKSLQRNSSVASNKGLINSR